MLRLTLEKWPYGLASRRQPLGTLTITNDGTGTPEVGHYDVTLDRPGRLADPTCPGQTWQRVTARVDGFGRDRGPWALVRAALEALAAAAPGAPPEGPHA